MVVKVKVQAGARKETLAEDKPDSFVIKVKEKAEQGLANARVAQLIGLHFGVFPERVRLIKGRRSPNKVFVIDTREKGR